MHKTTSWSLEEGLHVKGEIDKMVGKYIYKLPTIIFRIIITSWLNGCTPESSPVFFTGHDVGITAAESATRVIDLENHQITTRGEGKNTASAVR